MSFHDYSMSKALEHAPFYALIMAALRKADAENFAKLEAAFPTTLAEMRSRQRSPTGRIASDRRPS